MFFDINIFSILYELIVLMSIFLFGSLLFLQRSLYIKNLKSDIYTYVFQTRKNHNDKHLVCGLLHCTLHAIHFPLTYAFYLPFLFLFSFFF